MGSRNAGASARAGAALLAGPARGNLAIAADAGYTDETVRLMRRELEAAGVIPRNACGRPAPPHGPKPSRTRDAIAELGAAATPRAVADAARVSIQAAWMMLRIARAQPLLPGRACGPLPVGGQPFPVGWHRETDAALAICNRWCPCLRACAAWAVTQPGRPGVLGGLTQAERRRVALPT